ncbi:MAG: GntR family transcriptional regulator [Pseudomonadota bacterium]
MTDLPPPEPQPRGTRDLIAAQLRKDVMQGRLQLGQKIVEKYYAEAFKVSRTPVREAILSLVPLGLVTVKPQAGTYVVSFSKRSIRELFAVRRLIEVGGVRMASDTKRVHLVADLRKLFDNKDLDVKTPDDFDALTDVDTKFHTRLVAAAGNAQLMRMYRPIEVSAQAARSRLDKTMDVASKANAHHLGVIKALERNDLNRFEDILSEHLRWVLGMLLERPYVLGSCEPPDPPDSG